MLLKKQTVWLLTMLSLVFVLSAYYFIGDQQAGEQMANEHAEQPAATESAENHDGDQGEAAGTDGEEGTEGTEGTEGAEGTEGEEATEEDGSAVVKYISTDETFAEMRYELENLRSVHRAELKDRMASTELPAEEISKAVDQYNELAQISEKELILESTIRSRKDVDDALVRVTDGKIRVTVKTAEHSPQMANDIYHMVRQEFADVRNENIAFEFSTADASE
ncbi:SpoIIIAH-like family protein [Sutcliffiella horikoshii]|uniref:SpoIIIAH-like family protein n=1 Tax=Sutcliffiella horikoshii TaxID=79883 RepID=UPI001F19FA0F|nr:SpoIIIAH-like family protein [Sutcliffiella horikoshii]MCG1022776.1 SpoIIIAH-like family protein [Sutcliffiella horikoshii]